MPVRDSYPGEWLETRIDLFRPYIRLGMTGALYAQAGMLTESSDELRKVAPGDSSYSIARTLLESLPSTSPDDTTRVVL